MFFQGKDAVHETMGRVVRVLENAGIAYAIVGGMAVNAHGHRRTTDDVDFLLTSAGFDTFVHLFDAFHFERVAGRPRRFRDVQNRVAFDVLVAGLFPGNGEAGPIAYPDPAAVRVLIEDRHVVNLPMLIQLKIAARRHHDFPDVVNLIGVHNLDESFVDQLHPSVRPDYIECLEEKRREDEYEARQDEQFLKQTEQPPAKPSGE